MIPTLQRSQLMLGIWVIALLGANTLVLATRDVSMSEPNSTAPTIVYDDGLVEQVYEFDNPPPRTGYDIHLEIDPDGLPVIKFKDGDTSKKLQCLDAECKRVRESTLPQKP